MKSIRVIPNQSNPSKPRPNSSTANEKQACILNESYFIVTLTHAAITFCSCVHSAL